MMSPKEKDAAAGSGGAEAKAFNADALAELIGTAKGKATPTVKVAHVLDQASASICQRKRP